jgi:hypothetical protein
MRHVLLIAAAALGIALALVLVVGEDEAGEDAPPNGRSVPLDRTEAESPPETPAPKKSRQLQQVERAVVLYIEAVERGDIRTSGLPTTDELSIDRIVIRRRTRARVLLAGGAEITLTKGGGRWRVDGVSPGRIPPPTPPSNGP